MYTEQKKHKDMQVQKPTYIRHMYQGEKSYNDLETWKLVKKQGDLVRI